MVQFVCDNCQSIKGPKESWILGLAADTLGITSASREISILQGWDAVRAADPLAVHFCSVECKDRYVEQLFADRPPSDQTGKRRAVVGKSVQVAGQRARKPGSASRRKRAA
jgi:hypothetical protein